MIKNLESVKERYLRDSLPVRLGGLAANLARVSSFAENPKNQNAVSGIIRESEFFIEWTAPDAVLDIQVKLVELQRQLGWWHDNWPDISHDKNKLKQVIQQFKEWSEQILKLSGLVE